MVPHHPIGVIAGLGMEADQEDLQFAVLWVDGDVATDLFSVYLKAGDTEYEKLNSDLVRRGPLLGIPYAPEGLGFLDPTFDIESTLSHSYYVVATNSRGRETAPSEMVELVPADIDPYAQVTNLTPDTSQTVGLNPTFNWDPVSGAASYLFVLEEDTESQGSLLKWIYRTSKPHVTLHSTDGITYSRDIGASLRRDTDYSWSVYAVNSNNATFAAAYDIFATDGGGQ
jgi:hypothetical protein